MAFSVIRALRPLAAVSAAVLGAACAHDAPPEPVVPAPPPTMAAPAPEVPALAPTPHRIGEAPKRKHAPPPPPPPPPEGWVGGYSTPDDLQQARWWDRQAPYITEWEWGICRRREDTTSYLGEPPCGYMR